MGNAVRRWTWHGGVGTVILLSLLAAVVSAVPALAATSGSSPCASVSASPFTDVPADQTHARTITCLHELGIVAGRTAELYAPAATLTYGQLASFVVRTADVADVALPAAGDELFDAGSPTHGPAIGRLAAAGMLPVAGWQYDANAVVSRSAMSRQVALLLDRAGVLAAAGDGDAGLTDIADDPARDAIVRLAAAGVVRGRADGSFQPQAHVQRDQMATFLAGALELIDRDGEPLDPTPAVVPAPEGWIVAGGTGPRVGDGGTTVTYTVEVADGLEQRMGLDEFADRVERTLSDPDQGWTARGAHRLQRVDAPATAQARVLLAAPATVDRLCARAGLQTAGRYSCWNGTFAAINADRWFSGVGHVPDLELYRAYVVNHEVGHALGRGHRACGGSGQIAPVMMQLTKSTYGCQPNGVPYP